MKKKKQIIEQIEKTNYAKLIKQKIGLNSNSFMEKYFSLLKEISKFLKYASKIEYKRILQNFETFYFVDNSSIKIPLIYGTKELKYSALINNLYQYLFCTPPPKIEANNNTINKFHDFENYPFNVIKKKDKTVENKDKTVQENDQNNSNNKNIGINEDEIDEKQNYISFIGKTAFMNEFLEKILDDDFYIFFDVSNKFNEKEEAYDKSYILKPEIDSLYFHLLYFDLLICIYSLYGDRFFIKSFSNNFFENRKTKLKVLKLLQKMYTFKISGTDKTIKFSKKKDINNKEYLIVDKANPKKFFKLKLLF